MITIIVGVIISFFTFLFAGWYALIPIFITGAILLLPVEGFEDKDYTVHNLIKLESGEFKNSENTYYIIKDGNKITYAEDIRGKYNLNIKCYEEFKVKGKVRVFESDECEKPVLRVYTAEAQTVDFTFSPIKLKEYVFVIPKGTVYTKV